MLRMMLMMLVHLVAATAAAVTAIVLTMALLWFAYPWFEYLLAAAGTSWETRQRIAESLLRPELYVIVPTVLALVAYLGALGCSKALLRRAVRP